MTLTTFETNNEIMSNQTIQQFIKDAKVFKLTELARIIDMDVANFHKWLNGHRTIPAEKFAALESAMTRFGYKPTKK